ncbi:MAG: hypothetical protein E7559_02790 [Ruminococcaceae bacterium]|nr:hypothetical protein [Oscillospiraceae bacterium]
MTETSNNYVICGQYPHILAALDKLNCCSLVVEKSTVLPSPVARHADMLCINVGGRIFTYDSALLQRLSAEGFCCAVPSVPQGGQYPHDVGLNCLLLDGYMVCNVRHCAPEVLAAAEQEGLQIVHVNQGYTRCSTAVVNSHAVITADCAIAEVMRKRGIEVLNIRPGHIAIEQYDYGFIGGCCTLLREGLLLFSGDPMTHPDGAEMVRFIRAHGCDYVVTPTGGENMLYDFGGCVVVGKKKPC